MARFTLTLVVACAIGTGFATAFDEAGDGIDSLKNATPAELRAKIRELELEVARLKSEQKNQAAQQAPLPMWWNLSTTRSDQASPVSPQLPPGLFVPPGLLDLPQFHDFGGNGSQYPTMRNAARNPTSDMPKGTTARQFNGMTIYNVPCVLRTLNGVPEYAGSPVVAPHPVNVATPPSVGADLDGIRQAESKRQLELQRFYQRKNRSIQ